MKLRPGLAVLGLLSFLVPSAIPALSSAGPATEPAVFAGLKWRSIGPYRGGRTRAVAGVPSQPNVFYIGVCNGGVWKSTDYGRIWVPIFDDQPTGSIGAIAVAPSNPDIVYVASGEGLQRPDLSVGDGIYKSTDAGRTWTHLGLRDGRQIPQIAVDPRNPDRVFAAVLGHPYGPNEERGIYRSLDGGRTFKKVLGKDADTGGSEVIIDQVDPDVVYAGLWESRQGPWENAAWSGTGGGLFKSTDGGENWRQLQPAGVEAAVQVNLAVAPSDPKRLYAVVAMLRGQGIFRSDDAGETWRRATTDSRPSGRIGGGDLPRISVHPQNPDILFVASTVSWKSTDGGRSYTAFRGAPGGDDYQNIWINPVNPDILLYASDQGAVVTVNGGKTWSSWYNQPTAQLYHVAADNGFPYRVYSGQQESGSVGILSRGDHGRITFREWSPVAVDEYGYAAPDPRDPNIVYGGRSVTRWDRRTGQAQTVGPKPVRTADFRTVRTAPVVFSPVDPRRLYFASNTLWMTSDGGNSWTQISPDLTRKTWDVPATVGKYLNDPSAKSSPRGVIYTVAPSYVDVDRIWVGTDDGLIHTTADGGKTWTDVTPPGLKPWEKVSIIDAGRFSAGTAYAAINTLRMDDLRPRIYRTHDGGTTWTAIIAGLPDGAPVNAVREDPRKEGLLFAGTEREIHVSFDDGVRWQSLRLNMPATSMRDLIVKDDDLVVATHGRGFWILDDITPLRQTAEAAAAAGPFLFEPQTAIRVRWNMNTDTPLPPDEPAGQNPPDGAIIDYLLKEPAKGPVVLEILDQDNRTVRRYSSDDPSDYPTLEAAAVPIHWYRPAQKLGTEAGAHRFAWDMRFQPLAGGGGRGLPIAATPYDTVPTPASIWAAPGTYTVRLIVDGTVLTRSLTLKMDPRITASREDLVRHFELSKALYDSAAEIQSAAARVRAVRAEIKALQPKAGPAGGEAVKALSAFDDKASSLESAGTGAGRAGGSPTGGGAETLSGLAGSLTSIMNLLQGADAAPTSQVEKAAAERLSDGKAMRERWTFLMTKELSGLNAVLRAAGLPAIGAAGNDEDTAWKELKARGELVIVSVKDSSVQDYFLSVDQNGGLAGFDGEIIGGFCRIHGLEPRVIELPRWADVVPALLERRADLAAGELTASPERKKSVAFADEVFPTRMVAVNFAPHPPIMTVEEFRKAKVGATEGSSMIDTLAAVVPPDNIVKLSIGSLFTTLRAGGVDALVWGIEQALVDAKKYPGLQLGLFIGPVESLAYALRKEEGTLLERLNAHIAGIRQTGEWERLVKKTFGDEAPAALKRAAER